MIYAIIYAAIGALFFIAGLALYSVTRDLDRELAEASTGSVVLSSLIMGIFWPVFLTIVIVSFIKS